MTFDEQLRRAFDTLTDRLHDDIRREVQIAVDEALTAYVAPDPAAPASIDHSSPADAGTTARLVDAIRSIGRARSLSETLDTLAGCAAREAARAAVLTIRGGRVHGWRFIGCGALDHETAIDWSFGESGIIADAVRANAITSGPAPTFVAAPADEIGVALPIALSGEVVAVLYADNASSAPVLRQAQDAPSVPRGESQIPNPDSRPSTGSGRADFSEGRPLSTEVLEILTRYSARTIEALTAFKVARLLVRDSNGATAGADDEDAAARRYARLLVSEIRLYHEDAVAAGRRERDLATRLAGEITRARAMYEQRVPPEVRDRATRYFNDELVRTLAGGDSTLLQLT